MSFGNDISGVAGYVSQNPLCSAWPLNVDPVGVRARAKPEVYPPVAVRQITGAGAYGGALSDSSGGQDKTRMKAVAVRLRSNRRERNPVVSAAVQVTEELGRT